MKWSNKGHEFDELGAFLSGVKTIWIWGAHNSGEEFLKKLKWLKIDVDFNILFIDSNSQKQGVQFCGYITISPKDFLSRFVSITDTLVIAASDENSKQIASSLDNRFVKGKNFFFKNTIDYLQPSAERVFLSVLMLYKYNKLYWPEMMRITGEKCNLKCKKCLNFIPYVKNAQNYDFNYLCASIDLFFSRIDYVGLFAINGGETFTLKCLPELLLYVNSQYAARVNKLLVLTNGMCPPSNEIVEALRISKSEVIVDDYRKSVPNKIDLFCKTISLFEKGSVNYYILNIDNWLDLTPEGIDNSKFEECELISYRTHCNIPFRNLVSNKLYACAYASFATVAGIIEDCKDDYIDIRTSSKEELLEYQVGFTERGYVGFCKQCAGYLTINNFYVPVAEQEVDRCHNERKDI